MTPAEQRAWDARQSESAFHDYVIDTLGRVDERSKAMAQRLEDHIKDFDDLGLSSRIATLEERTPAPGKTATVAGSIGGVLGAMLATLIAMLAPHLGG